MIGASFFRLSAVLLLFGGLCLVYILSIPPLEGSDEFEHFAHVAWLAEKGSFPPQGQAAWETAVRQEASQPPLYYFLASLPARLAGFEPPIRHEPNPYFRYELDPTLPDNKNTVIHDPADTRPVRGAYFALYLARGVSTLSGMLLIGCVYGLAKQVLANRPGGPLAATLFVATMPQVIFHSSHVSNDMLAAALAALALWRLADLLQEGVTPGRAIRLGLVLGLAALTKVNTLTLGLPIGLAFGWLWFSGRDNRRSVIKAGIATVGSFLAVAGWWFARSWWLYGSPFGLDTHCYQAWATCQGLVLRWPLWIQWRDIFYSFWAAFGLANIRPYDWVYWLFAGLMGLAGWGLGMAWWQKRRPLSARGMVLLCLAAGMVGSLALLEVWLQQVLATYGRLLFPALAGFVVLLIEGLWHIQPRLARWAWLLPATLAFIAPFWLIRPAYARPEPLTQAEVAALGQPVGWQYGDFAKLLIVEPLIRSVPAGQLAPIRLCWQALAPADKNYTLFVQLIGPQNGLAATRHTYPGLGSYPTAIWLTQPDLPTYFCEVVRVAVPAGLDKTLVYQLEVGFVDEATGQRVAVKDGQGNPIQALFVGQVRLSRADEEPMRVAAPAGTPAIQLLDHHESTDWRPGQSYAIDLSWWVSATVTADYTVFVHLRRPADQSIIAQADGQPLEGWYPTSWWTKQEVIRDEHTFRLPAGTPRGTYDLVIGLYDPLSGQRLGPEYRLTTIEVR